MRDLWLSARDQRKVPEGRLHWRTYSSSACREVRRLLILPASSPCAQCLTLSVLMCYGAISLCLTAQCRPSALSSGLRCGMSRGSAAFRCVCLGRWISMGIRS